jgi:hypothetical protein
MFKRFSIKKEPSQRERQVKSIVEGYMDQYGSVDHVDAIVAPRTSEDDYLILDKKNKVYISIEHRNVTISNHAFLYQKEFTLEYVEGLKKMVRNKISAERQKLKEELFKNEQELLEKLEGFSAPKTEKTVTKPQ